MVRFSSIDTYKPIFSTNIPAIHGQSRHHYSRVPLLAANVNRAPITSHVRIPRLDNVRLVDEDVRINIGGVDPIPRHVLGQTATRLHHLGLHRGDPQTLGALLDRLKGITLRSDRYADVQIVVAILQEAPVLFVLSRLLRIRHREEVILFHEPIAQATVFHQTIEGPFHSRALLVRDVEFLIGYEELRACGLTRLYLCVRIITLSRKSESILK